MLHMKEPKHCTMQMVERHTMRQSNKENDQFLKRFQAIKMYDELVCSIISLCNCTFSTV